MHIVTETDIDWDDINYGECIECDRPLDENEHAIGDICDGCRPAFIEKWKQQQEAEEGRRNEECMYPEISDDDYLCNECGGDVRPPSWTCTNRFCDK